jgi:hypothetical protein
LNRASFTFVLIGVTSVSREREARFMPLIIGAHLRWSEGISAARQTDPHAPPNTF